MIDIDKYEGHTLEYGMHWARLLEHMDTEPNRRLIADALPLLEEVKRLFEEVKGLRGLLHELADAYGDEEQVGTLVYEIYGEFGGVVND